MPDGEAAGPKETEAPEETEIIEEEYTGAHIRAEESEPEAEEPLPEDLPEELIEEQPEEPLPEPEPEEEIAAEPEPAVLPEIDLDELDFSDLGLTFTKKPAAPVMPAAPEEEPEEEAGETPDGPAENEEPLPLEPLYPEEVLPDDEPRRIESADEILDALLADAAAELLPEEEADKPAHPDAEEPAGEPADGAAEETADEAPAEPEPEMPEPEEPETPDSAEDVSEILPAEESFPEEAEEAAEAEEPAEEPEAEEEYEYEEIETRRPVSGGRAFAAVVVTIPMLAVWALLFGLSLALGIAVLGHRRGASRGGRVSDRLCVQRRDRPHAGSAAHGGHDAGRVCSGAAAPLDRYFHRRGGLHSHGAPHAQHLPRDPVSEEGGRRR